MNFLGVLRRHGGGLRAVYMLPNEMIAGINTIDEIALFLALIVTALGWNFGTWWLGMPNSTTHTYIGSIIGVAMAHAFVRGQPVLEQINWHQGQRSSSPLRSRQSWASSSVSPAETDSALCEGSRNVPSRAPSQAPPGLGHVGSGPAIDGGGGSPIAGSRRRRRRASSAPKGSSDSRAAAGRLPARPGRPPGAIRAGLIAGSAGVAFCTARMTVRRASAS